MPLARAHHLQCRLPARPPARSFWGIKPDGTGSEPDNLAGGEYCGAANYSETRQDLYAWSDSRCSARLPYMCMIRGGRQLAGRGVVLRWLMSGEPAWCLGQVVRLLVLSHSPAC